MHPGMQLPRVWFPVLPSQPGSPHAKFPSWPGWERTPDFFVPPQPGSFGAGAHTRAWRLRAQGDGGKLLGLPPRFPPFTAHLPLPLSLFFFLSLIVSAGWFFSSPSNPASIFLIRVVLMPLSLSICWRSRGSDCSWFRWAFPHFSPFVSSDLWTLGNICVWSQRRDARSVFLAVISVRIHLPHLYVFFLFLDYKSKHVCDNPHCLVCVLADLSTLTWAIGLSLLLRLVDVVFFIFSSYPPSLILSSHGYFAELLPLPVMMLDTLLSSWHCLWWCWILYWALAIACDDVGYFT